MMKILFVSPGIYPAKIGGLEIFNYYLINKLANYYDITLMTLNTVTVKKNVNIIKIKHIKPFKLSIPVQIFFHILFLREKPKIIHLSYARSYWLSWIIYPLLKRIFGINYVVTIHGGKLDQWKPYRPIKWFFDNAFSITAVSTRASIEYQKRVKNKKVIYTPPLIPFQTSKLSTEVIFKKFNLPMNTNIILYVGSIKKIKSTNTLIDAFLEMGKRFIIKNSLILLIAGEGELKDKLLTKSANSEISERIIFLGNVARENVNDLYKIAKLYVITSLFENTPLSLLEAIYNQLPIVASDAPGIKDIITDDYNGLLFKTGNVDDLIKKIKKLLNNPQLSLQLSKNAYRFYKANYSYDNLINQFYDIFGELSNE